MARYASRFDDFVLLLLEHPRGVTCREAAGELGTSRQTIYKYVDLARARLGYNLIREADGRYRFPARYLDDAWHSFTLDTAEVHDLIAAVRGLSHVSSHVRSALDKIRRGIGGVAAQEFEETPVVHFVDGDSTSAGVYERVVRAARENYVLEVSYLPATGVPTRLSLRPYGLLVQGGHMYVAARTAPGEPEHGDGAILRLRLDQIQQAVLTRTRFKAARFDLAEYAASTFGPFGTEAAPTRVRVWFSPEKVGFIQRTRRHPSQICEASPDGSCVMTLNVPVTEDLVWWVAGYGRHALVLEPDGLRQQVIEHARGILAANSAVDRRATTPT